MDGCRTGMTDSLTLMCARLRNVMCQIRPGYPAVNGACEERFFGFRANDVSDVFSFLRVLQVHFGC
jgi:hypothetical protein